MYKFSDISNGSMIVLIFLLVLQVYWYYDDEYDVDLITTIDFNGDGVVSRKELKHYFQLLDKKSKKKKIKLNDLIRSSATGALRGFIMGFILQDWHGGWVLALICAIINPLIENTGRLTI